MEKRSGGQHMADWRTDNKERLMKAMQAAANNPEKLLVNAAANGDTETVKFLLDHDINAPGNYVESANYVAFKPTAYQRAFDAAAKDHRGGAIAEIVTRASEKLSDFSMATAVFNGLFADPVIHPEAETGIAAILKTKPDCMPFEIREVAKRLVEATGEQKLHLRKNMHGYLKFYANKKFYTELAKHRADHPAPLMDSFKKGGKDKKDGEKKTRPSHLHPVN
ncbi:MAG: hypothetical protein EA357_06885 [Micavibrio sp.]|nr:MAG: hypothetical protein EA357_06885 [Micavibrio sp.]